MDGLIMLGAIVVLSLVCVLAQGESLLSCDTSSADAFGYRCNGFLSEEKCDTFVILRTNSYYSSLFNLSSYLGLDRRLVAEASGISTSTEFLPKDQPLLIPVDCACHGDFFEAIVTKTTIKGESFLGISESLEGLTTCKAIQEKNKDRSPWGLEDKIRLSISLRCACPSPLELSQGTKLLVTHPVSVGDTIYTLASKFSISIEAIISSNNRSGAFKPEILEPFTTLLIPLAKKPILTRPFPNPRVPISGFPTNPSKHHLKKLRMRKIGIYIAISVLVAGLGVAALAVIIVTQRRKQKPSFCKGGDIELQHLSIRTKSEIKTVSEDSQDPFDTRTIDTTPHKMVVETYTLEEMKKATEDFSSSNLIEDAVFHGRLNGKNMAVKRTKTETISKIEFELFQEAYHHHPSIVRLLGTCLIDGPDSFLVFEYAKNGSLKDWLHGGLAMKSQFIASCYCFLTWNQRLRICLDVAMGLQYMHNVMNPSYVHRNIKSRNIFLDEEFNAKLGNFGMSRCTEDETDEMKSVSIHPACLSRGYLAAEYIRHGTISSNIDIYAYGVVLLEVLSGQTPTTKTEKMEEGIFLLSDRIKVILQSDDEEDLGKWMDRALGDTYSYDTAVTLANLARACVEEDPSLRPNAGEIVEKLSKLVDELPNNEQFHHCESSSKAQVKLDPDTVIVNFGACLFAHYQQGAVGVIPMNLTGKVLARVVGLIQGNVLNSTMAEFFAEEAALMLIQTQWWRTDFIFGDSSNYMEAISSQDTSSSFALDGAWLPLFVILIAFLFC